jgi:hypothetical protein
MWGEQQAREMLAKAGLPQVAVKCSADELFNSYYVATKG